MDASKLVIQIEREADGRWIAEVSGLPGVVAYGQTRSEAIAKVEALARRVLADRLDRGEPTPVAVELLRQRRLLVATSRTDVGSLTTETVEQTRSALWEERCSTS